MKIGAVHGRFQPLHNGHLKNYILPAKKLCDHLVIGITNPDPTLTLSDNSNLARTHPQNNPLTYFERFTIIKSAMLDAGLTVSEFSIVPFPINFPQLLRFYVPVNTVHYLTVFDIWGENKVKYLKQRNHKTKVLFRKDISEKKISSSLVRDLILKNKNWSKLVPNATVEGVNNYKIRERLLLIKTHLS